MTGSFPFRRILLKLSGEILLGNDPFGIDLSACLEIAKVLKAIENAGLETAVVIGGGNIFRGIHFSGEKTMRRTPADQIGMLATLMNGIALKDALHSIECHAKLISALECPKVAESYQWQQVQEYLSEKEIVIFVGGTGNPYFTTDTAAALRACEIQADILLKATKVDGVYSKDPKKYPDAIRYEKLSYAQVLAEKLQVMDATSIALCRQNNIPIFVFNMERLKTESVVDILSGDKLGTLIEG